MFVFATGALVHNYRVRRELRPLMWDYYALKLSGFRLELFLSAKSNQSLTWLQQKRGHISHLAYEAV